jgi:2-polyprenyl-6-methoxyphenol hydroxylase-like FAD-dependent oxidoreductase
VTVTFTDGTKETGNLLVGAEGAHSYTREWLVPGEEGKLLQSPCVASVTITKLGRQASINLRKLHPRYTISFHPNGTFTWMSSKQIHFIPYFVACANKSQFMTAPTKILQNGNGC